MVFPGIIRKLNKNLPALLQTIILICLIHYIGQSVYLKVQKKLHFGHYAYVTSTTTHRPGTGGKGTGSAGGGGGGQWKANGRPSAKFGGGFSRGHRPSSSTSTTTTTTTTTPVPPFDDDIMIEEQQRRLEVLHRACARWNMGLWSRGESTNVTADEKTVLSTLPKTPLYQALLVSEKHHLAVCPVARTGIQWLSRRLLQLLGKYDDRRLMRLQEPPSAIARHKFLYLSSWEKYPIVLAQSVTIMMARHPLDRLLASYRYLLEDPEKNPHGYLHYGRRIVRSYRLAPGHGKGPTFEEFVRFLLARDLHYLEEAWQPVVRKCTPCHIQYNMVTHYETLWHDVQWAWKKAGLGSLNTTDYVQYTLTPEIRRRYFSELTVSQILQLYTKYKLDFELFGYSLEEHMAYGKPGDEALDPVLMADIPRHNADHLQDLLNDALEQAQEEEEEEGEEEEEEKEEKEKKEEERSSDSEAIGERQAPPPSQASMSSSVGLLTDKNDILPDLSNFVDTGGHDLQEDS